MRPAYRVPVAATTTAPSGFILGEGWGCASLPIAEETRWQCWDAGPHPTAWEVPWLANLNAMAGRDRVCALQEGRSAFRCWQRPTRNQPPHELTEAAWLGTGPRPDENGRLRTGFADRARGAVLGAAFACLRMPKGGVFCVGDDRFGQRGGSSPPRPDADVGDPAFVRGIGIGDSMVAGTWHACALALRGALSSVYAVCWGRDDAGQLGAPANSTCEADGREVPCTREPVRGPPIGTTDGVAMLAAGDLFTCLATTTGIGCWGASRDGFFGAPDACPDLLRQAWPTAAGPLSAPRAACSRTPVPLPGSRVYPSWLAAGPRGLCVGDDLAGLRCLGAIPTPRGEVTEPTPSPGDDAAGCGISGDRIVCWGQGYAGAGALDRPVAVSLATTVPAGEAAAIDLLEVDSHVPRRAAGRQECDRAVTPLPACTRESAAGAHSWREVLENASAMVGQTIRVQGTFDVSDIVSQDSKVVSLVSAPLVLAGAPPLVLDVRMCAGLGSHLCCSLPAYGQRVVATGRLEALTGDESVELGSPFILKSPFLCEEKSPSR